MSERAARSLAAAARRASGMVVICGPAGTGKTRVDDLLAHTARRTPHAASAVFLDDLQTLDDVAAGLRRRRAEVKRAGRPMKSTGGDEVGNQGGVLPKHRSLCLAVATTLLLSACKRSNPAVMKGELDKMITELGAIRGALPRDAGESVCALTKLKTVKPEQFKFASMYVIDSDQLAVLTQSPPGQPRTDTNQAWRFESSPVFWQTSDRIAQPLDAAAYAKLGEDAKWYNDSEPYLAVLQSTARRLPQAGSGGTFVAGSFEGTLDIFDRETRKLACRAKLVATNTERVKTNAIGIGFLTMPIDQQNAVIEDFKKQLRGAAEATCRKMTSGRIGLAFPGAL